MLDNLRQAGPQADIVVYNSGGESFDLSGLEADVCPASRPLRYGRIIRFFPDIARWLVDVDRVPDYLILLEIDMMLIKHGFGDHLARVMGDAAYLGVGFHKVRPGWADNPIGRRARWKWHEGWRDLLGVPGPYHSYNPGQVFGREYLHKLARLPQLDDILARAEVSRLNALEEIIYPSLAIGMGCRGLADPGSHALTLRWYRPDELLEFVADPSVFLVHRVSTSPDAADRRLLDDALAGQLRPAEQYDARHVPDDPWRRAKILAERFTRRRWLDLTIGLRPEVPADFAAAAPRGGAGAGVRRE